MMVCFLILKVLHDGRQSMSSCSPFGTYFSRFSIIIIFFMLTERGSHEATLMSRSIFWTKVDCACYSYSRPHVWSANHNRSLCDVISFVLRWHQWSQFGGRRKWRPPKGHSDRQECLDSVDWFGWLVDSWCTMCPGGGGSRRGWICVKSQSEKKVWGFEKSPWWRQKQSSHLC